MLILFCYYYSMPMNNPEPSVPLDRLTRRRRTINSYKAKANSRRSPSEKFADWLTGFFGTVAFLGLNALWFLVWIVINTGLIPGIEPFDPFPFGLLTMVVSLEAIFLAIIVLISQNREAKIAEIREEVDLQINMIAEEEITKIIQLQLKLLEKQDIHLHDDPEIVQMLRPIHSEEIEHKLEKQLR